MDRSFDDCRLNFSGKAIIHHTRDYFSNYGMSGVVLSVALCTYNGEKFIHEQIQSILGQTMPVDEIVVCDDGSTDDTIAVIEGFREVTSTAIRICRNEQRLGVISNFQKAVDLCRGDIVFLCDQDDIWHHDKVSEICSYFEKHQDKTVLFSNGRLVDDNGVAIQDKTLWDCVGVSDKAIDYIHQGYGIELFAMANRATGATMAMKRQFKYLHSFGRYCPNDVLHDYAIALLALSDGQLGLIPQSLIDYRLHKNQQAGVGSYFDKPCLCNVYDTNYDVHFLYEVGYPEPVNSRLGFQARRAHFINKAIGLGLIFANIYRYCANYKSRWLVFMLSDCRRWFVNMVHRILDCK